MVHHLGVTLDVPSGFDVEGELAGVANEINDLMEFRYR
jgi:hypothetical protein